MRIEERKEIKEVVNNIYIAEDGTEFASERECKKYETEQEKSFYLEKLKNIECAATSYPPTLGEDILENNYFDWYRPKTNDELVTLNEAYPGINIDVECLNRWICVEHTEETEACGGYNYVSQIDMSMNYVKQLFNKLGYDVEFKER